MSTPQQQQQQQQQQQPPHGPIKHGKVKLIVSGDTITLTGPLKPDGPPDEKTICLSNVNAPKLGRRGGQNSDETRDEPYAWEAREFLRKKLIGQYVIFAEDKKIGTSTRTYGSVWLGKDPATGENIAESLVAEGLATVKREGIRNASPALQRLQEIEDAAKSSGKGKWSGEPLSEHIRDVKWTIDTPQILVDKYGRKPVKAIIEHVRDGSTVKALLLPDFYHITLMISGIRCPQIRSQNQRQDQVNENQTDNQIKKITDDEEYAKEAQYFVECRLLQKEVDVILESANNNNFVGSIIHPKGNIAEVLLSEGFARCVDWSMNYIKSGVDKLYMAEKAAKEKRLRRWKNCEPSVPQAEYNAVVVEIANSADAMIIRTQNCDTKKIFLSSIRPPIREKKQSEDKNAPRPKIYDIPHMYEAREFLRKKLIRKQVRVVEDYVQPAKDTYPEKVCCTVTVGKVNIAEAMVSKGLATVIRYKQDDDKRSSHYNELLAAENKAEKSQHGLHAKKDAPPPRIMDLSNDPMKAKHHISSLKRARGTKGVVEFVTSGSRLKIFLPKENSLITFLLAGVKAPRRTRPAPGGGGGMIEGEKYAEEAFQFMKEHTFQRDVEIQVETLESKGSGFIGWLFVDGVNMSVALVEEGLAKVSTFTENGEYLKLVKAAEERAKAQNLNLWKDCVEVEPETEKIEEEKEVAERKVDYREVVVSEITDSLHFYAQYVDQRAMVEGLLARLRQELEANPPLPGAFNPKRGDLVAAKFSVDDQWYRAKVEKISGANVSVFYIDYGNRETINVTRIAPLLAEFNADKPYAHEYILAFVELPEDNEDRIAALTALQEDLFYKPLLLNVEYKVNGIPAATLLDASTKEDLVKALVTEGYLIVPKKPPRSSAEIYAQYEAAKKEALNAHRLIWQYGDISGGNDDEFPRK